MNLWSTVCNSQIGGDLRIDLRLKSKENHPQCVCRRVVATLTELHTCKLNKSKELVTIIV